MTFFLIFVCLLLLILLISYWKVDAFLSLVIVSIVLAILLGIPLGKIPSVVEKGIGNMLGSLTLTVVFGAMLGKLVAESGAAQKIAEVMANIMGIKNMQWGLMITGFIVGIPYCYASIFSCCYLHVGNPARTQYKGNYDSLCGGGRSRHAVGCSKQH